VREIIRTAVAQVFDQYFGEVKTDQIEQWFNLGGTVQLNDDQRAADSMAELKQIQGLFERLAPLQVSAKTRPEIAVSAAEFLLEGMYAHKRLSRTEERSFSAGEKTKIRQEDAARYAEKMRDREAEREEFRRSRMRRGFN
jgi:magnesium chelatase subunit I